MAGTAMDGFRLGEPRWPGGHLLPVLLGRGNVLFNGQGRKRTRELKQC